jgi:hypothetical protein
LFRRQFGNGGPGKLVRELADPVFLSSSPAMPVIVVGAMVLLQKSETNTES